MKINEDFLPLVISPTEPQGKNKKKVWIQKGKNLFNINKCTKIDINDTEIEIVSNNIFKIRAISSSNNNASMIFRVIDLTTYAGKTLTIRVFAKSSSNNKAFVVLRQSDYNYGTKTNELYDETQNTTDGVIVLYYKVATTITDSNRYLFIGFYATRQATCNIGDYVNYRVQIEQNQKESAYEDYIEPAMYIKNSNDVYEEFIKAYNVYTKEQLDDNLLPMTMLKRIYIGDNQTVTFQAGTNGVYLFINSHILVREIVLITQQTLATGVSALNIDRILSSSTDPIFQTSFSFRDGKITIKGAHNCRGRVYKLNYQVAV